MIYGGQTFSAVAHCVWDSSNCQTVRTGYVVTNGNNIVRSNLQIGEGNGNYQVGVITVDVTNIIIAWTKIGTPPDYTAAVSFACEA